MDLQTRDRASEDVATLPAREPGVSGSSTERSQASGRLTGAGRRAALTGAGLVLVTGGLALGLAISAGVAGVRAVPGVLLTSLVAVALFGLCGWGISHALVRGRLASARPLLILPAGALTSSFALAVLGLFHVPFKVSLGVVIGLGVLSAWRWRTAPVSDSELPEQWPWAGLQPRARVGIPLLLAGLIGLTTLIPIFRAGGESIPGQNGDAILVAGSAVLVEHAPPTAIRNDLPINRIPVQWRSKYPIYYALAAVATLAGQTPIQAFAPVSALVLVMAALGLFLFAAYALRAPPWVSVAALLLVPLQRMVMFLVIHPFYNELWAQFSLPFILLCGWLYLREPSRRSAILFVAFLVFGLLVYPLMYPFPVLFLVPYAWGRWRRTRSEGSGPGWIRELRLPGVRGRPWLWIPAVVIAVPVLAVLGRGFIEKVISALEVVLPGGNLAGWSGRGIHYLAAPPFVGMPGQTTADYVGFALVCVLGALGLRRVRPEVRTATAVMVGVTALGAIYFRLRTNGTLFYFKEMGFLGPYLLLLALIELAALLRAPRRVIAAGAAAATATLAVVVPVGAAREINRTYVQVTGQLLALRSWSAHLPPDSSILIDLPPGGWQLWSAYMLYRHPLSTRVPLSGFFPHPAASRKADYLLDWRSWGRPRYVVGRPVFSNSQFYLWRMKPTAPGRDLSRRGLEWGITTVKF